jgi:hypothetical protein
MPWWVIQPTSQAMVQRVHADGAIQEHARIAAVRLKLCRPTFVYGPCSMNSGLDLPWLGLMP